MSVRDADGKWFTPVEAAIVFFHTLQQWGADIEVDANYRICVDLSRLGPHPFDSLDELRQVIEYFRGPLQAMLWSLDQRVH